MHPGKKFFQNLEGEENGKNIKDKKSNSKSASSGSLSNMSGSGKNDIVGINKLLSPSSSSNSISATTSTTTLLEDNFYSVFRHCPTPWALARVDGRLCDCNDSFLSVSGFSRAELLSFTIFNLINAGDLQDTFR